MQQRTQPIIIICRVEARGVLEHPKHPPGHATDDTFWSLVNTQSNFSLSLSLSLSRQLIVSLRSQTISLLDLAHLWISGEEVSSTSTLTGMSLHLKESLKQVFTCVSPSLPHPFLHLFFSFPSPLSPLFPSSLSLSPSLLLSPPPRSPDFKIHVTVVANLLTVSDML